MLSRGTLTSGLSLPVATPLYVTVRARNPGGLQSLSVSDSFQGVVRKSFFFCHFFFKDEKISTSDTFTMSDTAPEFKYVVHGTNHGMVSIALDIDCDCVLITVVCHHFELKALSAIVQGSASQEYRH